MAQRPPQCSEIARFSLFSHFLADYREENSKTRTRKFQSPGQEDGDSREESYYPYSDGDLSSDDFDINQALKEIQTKMCSGTSVSHKKTLRLSSASIKIIFNP